MHRRLFLAALALAPLLSACMAPSSAPAPDNLMGRLAADPDLSTFTAMVQAAGLQGRLAGTGPYTVFAPTNAAFARLGQSRVAALMQPAHQGELATLVMQMIGQDNFTPQMLAGQQLQIATLGGGSVVADGKNGLAVNRVPVSGTAIAATNGTIYKLSRVILR